MEDERNKALRKVAQDLCARECANGTVKRMTLNVPGAIPKKGHGLNNKNKDRRKLS